MEKEPAAFAERIKSLEPHERDLLLEAAAFAREKPGGNAGENIASILMDLKLDVHAVIAGLLMNSPGGRDKERVASLFGGQTAALLEGALKSSRVSGTSKTLLEAETIRNMLFVMTGDYRVLFILLAEKLSALRTPGSVNDEELKALARESLNVYAPLAVRLGLSWIKDELEDLALKILNRDIYRQIKDLVATKRAERKEFLSFAQAAIAEAASRAGIAIETSSRAKHFYSIYLKMRRRNKSAAEIFDLFGVRILCQSVEQCYTLLGIIHRLWKPIDGSFKDYIARPKPNGYQSLHTSVTVSGGETVSAEERFLEIQIRTREMHEVAEHGVASHWIYKRGSAGELIRDGESGAGDTDDGSWYDAIRREITKKSVYVFTPRGKAQRLPAGATPVDFAYAIHSSIGDHCIGAKADGAIIPLHSALRNVQTVEILTSPNSRPSVNWLESVKTSKARNKIRSRLEKSGAVPANEKTASPKKTIVVKQPDPPAESAASLSTGLVQRASPETMRVKVEDEKNMMVRFARCCNPVSGDPITGYVSRGRGIIIHRKNCYNLANIPDIDERRINAAWENTLPAQVRRFRIEAKFQANLFAEIEGAARKCRGSLLEGRLEENDGKRVTGYFTVRFEEPGDFKTARKKIRGIPGIIAIQQLS